MKELSWPIWCLQNMLASSQEGHLGRAMSSFSRFLSTQEGHRKGCIVFTTHLAQTRSHRKHGKKKGSPLKQLPTAEALQPVNRATSRGRARASHSQIFQLRSGSGPLHPQAGWGGKNIAETCGLLTSKSSKSSAEGQFLNAANQNTSRKQSSSCQYLSHEGDASCCDPTSATICHFSSSTLFSVWNHVSRQPPGPAQGGGCQSC